MAEGYCPHCHQMVSTAPAELRAAIEGLALPRREKLIADALLTAFPRQVDPQWLVERVYDLHDEPQWPRSVLHSHISKLRSKIVRHGWTIQSARFAGYRFRPLPHEEER